MQPTNQPAVLPIDQELPAKIAVRIMNNLSDAARLERIADVRIGLGYTAVMLADDSVGVAFTFSHQAQGGCAIFNGLRPLVNRPASDLLALLPSPDRIEAAVGLACANALINRDRPDYLDGDILDYLQIRPEDHVGMVGHFGPLVSTVEQRARKLTIFEQVTHASEKIRPAAEAEQTLGQCQMALITATSIINHTIAGLLKAARGCREVAILGASTPLLPEAFAGEKVTMLSGVVVQKTAPVLQIVSESGGMHQFRPHLRKVTLRITNPQTETLRATK